jgi:hypothetical protein
MPSERPPWSWRVWRCGREWRHESARADRPAGDIESRRRRVVAVPARSSSGRGGDCAFGDRESATAERTPREGFCIVRSSDTDRIPATTADDDGTRAAAERCYRLGPFADAAALAAAQAALRPNALRLRSRETARDKGRGWRVFLPAAADRAAADASADRLKAAGFTDLVVVADGAEANSIALGRFSTETRAQQHAETLRAAGFAAEAAPVGEARGSQWIEMAAAVGFDLAAARRTSGAAQSRDIDCAGLR